MTEIASMEDLLDGLALFQEHAPQTAEDWCEVARRCAADPEFDHTQSAPIFGAAVLLARALRASNSQRSPAKDGP